MIRTLVISLSFVLVFISCANQRATPVAELSASQKEDIKKLYEVCNLKKRGLSYDVLEKAMRGYYHIFSPNKRYFTLIDFSQNSTRKRLYLFDLEEVSLVLQTYVAHGKNTGGLHANHFSNEVDSRRSSLGFYHTAEIYTGKHGKSMRLDGLERGFNHRARERAIVIHAVDYATKAFIDRAGRLGRSWGCPAVPPQDLDLLLSKIGGQSVLFIYAKNADYLKKSPFMK